MISLRKKISAALAALTITLTSLWGYAGICVSATETSATETSAEAGDATDATEATDSTDTGDAEEGADSTESDEASEGDETTASVQDSDNSGNSLAAASEYKDDLLSEEHPDAPAVNAEAYVLIDVDSGSILLGNEYDVQREPASMTKVMTVLLALERLDMDEIVTITPEMAEALQTIPPTYILLNSANSGLAEGEEISVRDLVYASVLKSANDCALALGLYMGGTEEAFCKIMNERAAEMGCKNTHFSSAYGKSSPDTQNVTTPYDMCLILNEALQNTAYSEIATTRSYTIEATNKYSGDRTLNNGNRFLGEYSYEYYIGGKTGSTDIAGYTLCAAAKKNNRTLIGAIFHAEDADVRYSDLKKLFEYGFSTFTTVEITEGEFQSQIDEANKQITNLLSDTNLYISDKRIVLDKYVTTTSARAQFGSANKLDLSETVIDSQADHQTLEIPLCKIYSDKTYHVGTLYIDIEKKAGVVEINPEKITKLSNVRNILITFAVLSGLLLLLVISLLIFRARLLKRKREESTKRANML